jgi:Family of unknown function (DUF6519)
MQGDFTRNTHNPDKNFLRVLMQQGRVQLDADWNEQVSILLDYMQTLATDLIGPYGGPVDHCGFEIVSATVAKLGELSSSSDINKKLTEVNKSELAAQLESSDAEKIDFLIGVGNYYVHGKLCQNQKYELYSRQKYYPFGSTDKLENDKTYLVYLDVWERHITDIEDESELTPGIREVALGKADTTTRSQLIWQVKTILISDDVAANFPSELENNPEFLRTLLKSQSRLKPGTGLLKVRAKKQTSADNANTPCIISPDSRYRGAENQLYRVEIHTPGAAGTATFKWSRENASVIFPVQDVNGATITLGHLGWDDRSSLKQNDWVELVDDQYELQGSAKSLRQVDSIDSMEMTVKLKTAFEQSIDKKSHPILRRWNQQQNSKVKLKEEGTVVIAENSWIELEKGVEIYFTENATSFYATGDYWLIPARTATGDVEWPGGNLSPTPVPPHGVEHHYAPLSILSINNEGKVDVTPDFRRKFSNLGL